MTEVDRLPAAEREYIDSMFRELCREDPDAVWTCWAIYQFLHVVDDLLDRDVSVSPATLGVSLLCYTELWAANPFVARHRDSLLAALRVSVAEWVDSERWRTSEDSRRRRAVDVLKSQYQNVFYLIASLCGGPEHMLAMSAKYRDYDWEENAVDGTRPPTVTSPQGA